MPNPVSQPTSGTAATRPREALLELVSHSRPIREDVGALRPLRPPSPRAAAFTPARLYLVMAACAVGLASLSLLIPSTPSYDPWAWLVWGREIIHLDLHTVGGPSWKPLPMIFTTALAPFGRAAPDLWLVVARAGAFLAVAMSFKLAVRITRRLAAAPAPLLAGVLAAVGVGLSRGFVFDMALGYSEGLLIALALIALDLHLAGQRRAAFVFGFAAGLDRPELWLVWVPYGLYLAWRDPRARLLVASLLALMPALWFLPELWGAGQLLRGVIRAQHPPASSPAFARCPFCSELSAHAWPAVVAPVSLAALAATAAAVLTWARRRARMTPQALRARRALLLIGAGGFAWLVGIALETQAGFSGSDRYLLLGAALVSIAGGVAWGWCCDWLARATTIAGAAAVLGRWRLTTAALAVGVLLAWPPGVGVTVGRLAQTRRGLVYQAHLRQDLARAVARLGGAGEALRCGRVSTEDSEVPMLAWMLDVRTTRVGAAASAPSVRASRGVVFQTRPFPRSAALPALRVSPRPYRLVADVGTFKVFANCASNVTR